MLAPEDVGHRVVVRRIVDLRDDRPICSDLLGELVELTETEVTVRTVTGAVRVPLPEIMRAKRVPDKRAPTSTERLERIFDAGWPAPDCEPLGDWLLRAAAGWSDRGNSALAIGDPGRPLGEAVEAVEGWYRDRGLPPKITVPSPVGGRVTAELRRRRWHARPLVLVQTASLETVIVATAHRSGAHHAETNHAEAHHAEVRLDEAPPAPLLEMIAGREGALPGAAHHILTAVPQVRFAGVYDNDGAPYAMARGAVVDGWSGPPGAAPRARPAHGRWLGLSLVEVAARRRRRGLAREVTAALARWGASLGADGAYLQVEEANEAAVAFCARLGFATRHTYVTWVASTGL